MCCDEIEPGSDPSYEICKLLYLYHPIGSKLVDSPIKLALSQPRQIIIKKGPQEDLAKAFEEERKNIHADKYTADVYRLSRIYGVSAIAIQVVGQDPNTPLDYEKLYKQEISFSCFDPLNIAGSVVLNQSPNAVDFLKTTTIRVNGQMYHHTKNRIVMNEEPIYLGYTTSGFGYVGRSVFQRSLYPLKSYIETMRTNDMVVRKAGVLVAAIRMAGSIVDNISNWATSFKRLDIKQAMTNNVISIQPEDRIESLNMQNLEGPFVLARRNILEDIALSNDMPAILLNSETFAEGNSAGVEDSKAVARYIEIERKNLFPVFHFMDKIVMHRAWNPNFFEAMKNKYPELYGKMDYDQAFYEWVNSTDFKWPSLLVQSDVEKASVEEVKLKALIAAAELMTERADPDNQALIFEWLSENVNNLNVIINTSLNLDMDKLLEHLKLLEKERAETVKLSNEGQEMQNEMGGASDYQRYIHQSRYARYIDELGRRETWEETVKRYMEFFAEELETQYKYEISQSLYSEVYDAIYNHHVMPSMRALMTAGEAARRNNVCLYNCSALHITDLFSFVEILYILLCGTGVGFSVERQFIMRLLMVSSTFTKTSDVIVVEDSKEGWGYALYRLLETLFAGLILKIDYSNVRPAGSRLKVFGGRASGPEPLRELFEFITEIVVNAAGRKLTSLECHEIATKSGEAVVVGGVRRAALISLSNLSDLRMRNAKSGSWYTEKPHLTLANNSTAYTEKPEPDIFMEEWLALYNSRSGERGIFNREGVKKKLESIGIFDNVLMRGDRPDKCLLPKTLEHLKSVVEEVNYYEAARLGIKPSSGLTCIKPEGTSSQKVLSSSGITAGHAEYYIRRIRSDNKDPLTYFMRDQGFLAEPCVHKPNEITIFSFPIHIPGTKTRDQVETKDHMDLVLTYNEHWAEHNSSCTISVKKHEWPMVGGYVYDHFDEIVGMSFLPYFTESTVYKQLPYETITKEQYEELLAKMPKNVDWSKLADYDKGRDNTTGDRKTLFLKRGSGGDYPGHWCMAGGHIEDGEDALEAALRESVEELGVDKAKDPKFLCRTLTRAYDDDQEIDYTTYLEKVSEEFVPTINGEHIGYAWAPVNGAPQPLHPGMAISLARLDATEIDVARLMAEGLYTSPQQFENMSLFSIRITGTGASYRPSIDEYVYRPPEIYLNEEMIARCQGLPVIWEHPKKATLDSREFTNRIIGTILYPYIKGDELWGIARVYDQEAIDDLTENQLDTSPTVLFNACSDENKSVKLEDGSSILLEGKPNLMDHVAICPNGVWSKGKEPSGVMVRKDSKMADEMKKDDSEMKADAAQGEMLDKVLKCMDSLNSRMDAWEKEKEDKKKADAAEEEKKKADAAAKADADKKKADAEMMGEPTGMAADSAKADAEKEEMKKEMEKAKADAAAANDLIKGLSERLAQVEAMTHKQLTDGDFALMASHQAKADKVYQAYNDSAPRPMNGETPDNYRIRLLEPMLKHSSKWKETPLNGLPVNVLDTIEREVYADSISNAYNPSDLPEDELRKIVETDETGRRITKFAGKPAAWMNQFSAGRRRLAGIRNSH
ncbi:unnamed protein product [Sphagnum balticum]